MTARRATPPWRPVCSCPVPRIVTERLPTSTMSRIDSQLTPVLTQHPHMTPLNRAEKRTLLVGTDKNRDPRYASLLSSTRCSIVGCRNRAYDHHSNRNTPSSQPCRPHGLPGPDETAAAHRPS